MPGPVSPSPARGEPAKSRTPRLAGRRRRNPEATRKQILEAAEKLFIEHGFSRVPVSGIAREAGVAKSLIHHYFKNKEELWREVKKQRFEAYTRPLVTALSQDRNPADLQLLKNSMQDFFTFLDRNRDLVRLISWMDLEYDDGDVIYNYNDIMNLGIAAFKKQQTSGNIRKDIDPKFALAAILNMIIHWFQARSQWLNAGPLVEDRPETDREYLDTVLTIFFEGIRPRPTGERDSRKRGEQG